jgi:hypothetical protein
VRLFSISESSIADSNVNEIIPGYGSADQGISNLTIDTRVLVSIGKQMRDRGII